MKLFKLFRNNPPAEFPLHKICEDVLRHREAKWVYRDGVVDEAARRAALQLDSARSIRPHNAMREKETVINSIEETFREYERGPRDVGFVANG